MPTSKRRILSVRTEGRALKLPARLTREQWGAFEKASRGEGRSVTGQLSWLIRRFLGEPELPARAVAESASLLKDSPIRVVATGGGDLRFWLGKTPAERLAAVEFLRSQYYALSGYRALPRLARAVRVVERAQ